MGYVHLLQSLSPTYTYVSPATNSSTTRVTNYTRRDVVSWESEHACLFQQAHSPPTPVYAMQGVTHKKQSASAKAQAPDLPLERTASESCLRIVGVTVRIAHCVASAWPHTSMPHTRHIAPYSSSSSSAILWRRQARSVSIHPIFVPLGHWYRCRLSTIVSLESVQIRFDTPPLLGMYSRFGWGISPSMKSNRISHQKIVWVGQSLEWEHLPDLFFVV